MFEHRTKASREGANIRTWIGFKHFEYVVSDAIAEMLASRGFSSRTLALSGVRAHVVGSKASLGNVIECGDDLTVILDSERVVDGDHLAIDAVIVNDTAENRALKGTYIVKVGSFVEDGLVASVTPADVLGSFATGELKKSARPRPGSLVNGVDVADDVFSVNWTIPYYYCDSSRYLAYRGHVRAIESVVDDYLTHVGLFIPDILRSRAWIPVVSRYSFDVVRDVDMGTVVTTRFRVDEVLGDLVFNGSWSITAHIDGAEQIVASGVIQHGYAFSRGPLAGSMARMDSKTIADITREERHAVSH